MEVGSGASRFLASVAFAMAVAACGKTPIATAWYDLPNGEAAARAQHKPAVIFFGAAWSVADMRMERDTFTDDEVRVLLRDFIAIKVDVTDSDDPAALAAERRFHVVGDPTTVIVRSFDAYPADATLQNGGRADDLYRADTFVGASDFAHALRKAKLRIDRE